jgi:hypothetical protein
MSFAERLEQQVSSSLQLGPKRCILASLFVDERLSEDDRKKLVEVVDVPKDDPRCISSSNIALALRAEGIEISRTAIGDHRRKICRCYSKKEN